MKPIYFGRNETDEEFDRSCLMLTTIHPAGLGVLFVLAGVFLFHIAAYASTIGGMVMFAIIRVLNVRNVRRFRKLRALYQKGVFL